MTPLAVGIKDEGVMAAAAWISLNILREIHYARVCFTGVFLVLTWPFGRVDVWQDPRTHLWRRESRFPTLYLYLRKSPRTYRWHVRSAFSRDPLTNA